MDQPERKSHGAATAGADSTAAWRQSIEEVAAVHYKQLLTYLRLSGLHLGLLINFNVELIKDGITRIVNNLKD